MWLIFHILFRIRCEGKENLDIKKGFIICSNHRSLSDPIMLAISTPQKIFFMAKSELFDMHGRLFSSFIRACGAFPVRRDCADKTSVEDAEYLLHNGCIVGIFPQGKIVKDCESLKIKSGAAMLSISSNTPVVPAAIVYDGSLRLFKRVTVRFGTPIEPQYACDKYTKNRQYKQLTMLIKAEMEELLYLSKKNNI